MNPRTGNSINADYLDPLETVQVSKSDFERKILPALQQMAVDRLDELTRSAMTTRNLTSYPEALEIIRKENPDLVRVAYSQPSRMMADLSPIDRMWI